MPFQKGGGSSGSGSGAGAVLFNSTLAVDTAAIDTGAAGISQAFNVLEIFLYGRTDDAAVFAFHDMTINNDSSANYDLYSWVVNAAGGGVGSGYLANTWPFRVKANTGTAYFSALRVSIPNYANTTSLKSGEATVAVIDASTGNSIWAGYAFGHRTITAGISRLAVTAQGAAKFKAGTRLLIMGR